MKIMTIAALYHGGCARPVHGDTRGVCADGLRHQLRLGQRHPDQYRHEHRVPPGQPERRPQRPRHHPRREDRLRDQRHLRHPHAGHNRHQHYRPPGPGGRWPVRHSHHSRRDQGIPGNYYSGTVTPVTVATGIADLPITVGSEPGGIAITPDGATAYVADYGSGTVTPITIATNKASHPIAVGRDPYAIAITSDGAPLSRAVVPRRRASCPAAS